MPEIIYLKIMKLMYTIQIFYHLITINMINCQMDYRNNLDLSYLPRPQEIRRQYSKIKDKQDCQCSCSRPRCLNPKSCCVEQCKYCQTAKQSYYMFYLYPLAIGLPIFSSTQGSKNIDHTTVSPSSSLASKLPDDVNPSSSSSAPATTTAPPYDSNPSSSSSATATTTAPPYDSNPSPKSSLPTTLTNPIRHYDTTSESSFPATTRKLLNNGNGLGTPPFTRGDTLTEEYYNINGDFEYEIEKEKEKLSLPDPKVKCNTDRNAHLELYDNVNKLPVVRNEIVRLSESLIQYSEVVPIPNDIAFNLIDELSKNKEIQAFLK